MLFDQWRAPERIRRIAIVIAIIIGGICLVVPVTDLMAQVVLTSDPWLRYTAPGQCEQAALRLTRQYWRGKRSDTVTYSPATDTVPRSVLDGVRRCMARFSIAAVAPRELLNLAHLYLWTQQDDLARQAMQRLLDIQKRETSAAEQGWTLHLVIRSLLQARPAYPMLVPPYLRQLDALGVSAAPWQLLAHTVVARYAMSVDDRVTAMAQAKAAIAAANQLTHDDHLDWFSEAVDAYAAAAEPLALERDGPAVLAMLDTARMHLMAFHPVAQVQSAISRVGAPYTLLGTVGRPIVAQRWYGMPGNVVLPQRERVSILVFVNASCGPRCYPMYATLQRLYRQYSATGLDIILMSTTVGYVRDHVIRDAQAESDATDGYFLHFLQLPAILAMEETKYEFLVDGRRRNEEMMNSQHYAQGGSAVLVDRQGVVRLVATPTVPMREAVWNTVLREITRTP